MVVKSGQEASNKMMTCCHVGFSYVTKLLREIGLSVFVHYWSNKRSNAPYGFICRKVQNQVFQWIFSTKHKAKTWVSLLIQNVFIFRSCYLSIYLFRYLDHSKEDFYP